MATQAQIAEKLGISRQLVTFALAGKSLPVVSLGTSCSLIAKAREVLAREFPETARDIAIHVSDEKTRRVGQAVAAASLPQHRKSRRQ